MTITTILLTIYFIGFAYHFVRNLYAAYNDIWFRSPLGIVFALFGAAVWPISWPLAIVVGWWRDKRGY